MDDSADNPKMFRTLRGFLNGEEPDEANYFRFSATLRIHGDGVPFEEISQGLTVESTHLHRKGEHRGPRSPAWRDDAWHFEPALPETEHLNVTLRHSGKSCALMLSTSKRSSGVSKLMSSAAIIPIVTRPGLKCRTSAWSYSPHWKCRSAYP